MSTNVRIVAIISTTSKKVQREQYLSQPSEDNNSELGPSLLALRLSGLLRP
jgi:hypothetical protein